MAHDPAYDIPVYTRPARRFHWWVALFVFLQIPLGLYMKYRADEMPGVNDKGEPVKGVFNGIADGGLTETMYNSHKIIGMLILLLVLSRLFYRLTHGAPASDKSVPAALTGLGHLVHWLLYGLLIAMPVIGYIATSWYGALTTFGIPFPAVSGKDEKFADVLFGWHGLGAELIMVLVGLHILAAIYHKFVRKDRLVERMLPKKTRNA